MAVTPLDEAVSIIRRLNTLDKMRLIKRLAAMLENELSATADELPVAQEDEVLRPTTLQELVAWLDANPPTEAWGDLRNDEDAAEYIHRLRRQATVWLDDPGDSE